MTDGSRLSLAMLSHELKNSITLMGSTVQLVEDRYPEITHDPMWNQIHLDLQHMLQVISELSMIGVNEAIGYGKVNVRQLFREVETMFASEIQHQKKDIRFRLETSWDIIDGHKLMLRQLLINLIQNALEATNAGSYIDVVSITEGDSIVFMVNDTGCGMTQEEISSMFEPFVTQKNDGTGLGMVIVKNIVDAHQGSIYVESEKNRGTQIKVVLPVNRSI